MSKAFAKISLIEQESLISFDYYTNTISIYSCKESVCKKLSKILKDVPVKIIKFKGKEASYYYTIPMNHDSLTKVLSIGLFIGPYLRKKSNENL